MVLGHFCGTHFIVCPSSLLKKIGYHPTKLKKNSPEGFDPPFGGFIVASFETPILIPSQIG